MKTCTGERYSGEHLSLSAFKGWHGKFGHLNVLKMDHDSVVTGRGKHDRVVAFIPQYEEKFNQITLYCRVDLIWELGEPTKKQIFKVARIEADIKGKWKLATREEWDRGKHIDFYFVKA